jgi:hypothetical protein
MSTSIMFEWILKDYFHRSNLNLIDYLRVHNENELDEHRKRLHQFYVGSEQCPTLFLNTNISNLNEDMYILLFNSNIYKQTVFFRLYVSRFLFFIELWNLNSSLVSSLFSKFFFHLDHGEYKESIYFSLNQPVNRIKYVNLFSFLY